MCTCIALPCRLWIYCAPTCLRNRAAALLLLLPIVVTNSTSAEKAASSKQQHSVVVPGTTYTYHTAAETPSSKDHSVNIKNYCTSTTRTADCRSKTSRDCRWRLLSEARCLASCSLAEARQRSTSAVSCLWYLGFVNKKQNKKTKLKKTTYSKVRSLFLKKKGVMRVNSPRTELMPSNTTSDIGTVWGYH